MIYEVCELLATHLKDPLHGVNALSLQVPLAVGDPALEAAEVVSEFDVAYLPGGLVPESAYKLGPLVLVRRGDDVGEFAPPGNPEIMDDDSRVSVAILALYPRAAQFALDVENRRLSALLRAIRRSVGAFFEDVDYELRALRGVQVVGPLGRTRLVPTIGKISELDVMAGAVLVDCKVTDRWAEGITPLAP